MEISCQQNPTNPTMQTLRHALTPTLKPALVYSDQNSGLLEVHKDPLGTAVWFAKAVLFRTNCYEETSWDIFCILIYSFRFFASVCSALCQETSSDRCLHVRFACNMHRVLLQRLRSCKHNLNNFEHFCWSFSQGNLHPVHPVLC